MDMSGMGGETGNRALRHEFNNMVSAVVGSLKVVGRLHGDDTTTQVLIDNAVRSCDDMQAFVQKLLED